MVKTHYLLISTLALASSLFASPAADAFPIRLGLSPDNSQSLLISTLKSARSELVINMYQFDSPAVANALIEQIQAGITVKLLLEGQPVGNVSTSGEKVMNAILDAMARSRNTSNRFFLMTSGSDNSATGNKRRFRFDHAKYVVVDSEETLITSENFTSTGHADPGRKGNRGWETVLSDSDLSRTFLTMFAADTDTSFGDIQLLKARRIPGAAVPGDDHPGDRRLAPTQPQAQGDADSATLITSPNSQDGLVAVIRGARKNLAVEQMSLPSNWRDPEPGQSPLVTEILASARRGVSVRVLLNDENAFGGAPQGPTPNAITWPWTADDTTPKKRPNELTVDLLNQFASCENLDLEARIVDVKQVGITYIHNKGYLVDGHRALVSSIDGTRNSIVNNRETAVLLESEDAAAYFGQAFDFDWTRSPTQRTNGALRRKCPQSLNLSELFAD